MAKRPQPKTIKMVVEHLRTLGLSVYGPYIDLDTGERSCGCSDYDAEDIIKYRKLHEKDQLWVRD